MRHPLERLSAIGVRLMRPDTAAAEQRAETCWHRAMDMPHYHLTKSWELRAALRLSRLW
jgi:hypothetical protein